MTSDVALLDRLRASVGPDIADDVEPDEQVSLVLDLLERAREKREAQ